MSTDLLTEGRIHSISVSEGIDGPTVLVRAEDASHRSWLISATGVRDFLVEEMRLQNIIDQVTVFDASCLDDEVAKRRIFFLLRGRDPKTEDELKWPWVEEVVTNVSKGDEVLLEIEAVYGAYILLIAKSISLAEEPA